MKKSSIVKDYKYIPEPGTLNMHEKTNFITGKAMDIQDEIRIRKINVYDSTNYDNLEGMKSDCIISMSIDNNQSETEKNTLTKWILEIDSKKMLREYLFDQIYTSNIFSDFHKFTPDIVSSNKQGQACYEYIDNNILNRYKLKDFILWTKFYELKLGKTTSIPSFDLLKNNPIYTFYAKPSLSTADSEKSSVSIKEYADGILDVSYKQTKSSQSHTFLYYFDAVFYKL